jgi:hypothetical protein
MNNALTDNLRRAFYKTKFQLKKSSPEILIVTGIIGGIAAAVLACKATKKVDTVIDEFKDQKEEIKNAELTDDEMKKATVAVYSHTALEFVKLYGPSVSIGVASIACILTGHGILKKRVAAISAAYTLLDDGYKKYRKKVIEKFGEEVDKELKYGIKKETVVEEETLENGKTVKKEKEIYVANGPVEYSEYAKFFDESCYAWEKNSESNLAYLRIQEAAANEKLKRQGYLFLNDVYEMLGIPITAAGQVVGWIYDEDDPVGDNYVSFGIYDIHDKEKRLFVNGFERAILLDFNVDGNIISGCKSRQLL